MNAANAPAAAADSGMPSGLAQLWFQVGATRPTRPALIHDGVAVSWQNMALMIDAVAATLRGAGVGEGDAVVITLGNRPEHLIALAACLRAGAAPICTDPWELFCSALDDLSPAAVFFDAAYAEELASIRATSHASLIWFCGDRDAPSWSVPWPASKPARYEVDDEPSPECTTMFRLSHGHPAREGTIYRWNARDFAQQLALRPPWWPLHLDTHPERPGERLLVADRLLDSGVQNRALETLCSGGTVITTSRSHRELWDVAAEQGATSMAVVGGQLEGVHLETLADRGGTADLHELRSILTSGSPCPAPCKEMLLRQLPHARVVDVFETAEGLRLAHSIATAANVPPSGHFHLGVGAWVVAADGRRAHPGDEGQLVVVSPQPVGLGVRANLPADRLIDGDGEKFLSTGAPARLIESGEVLLMASPGELPEMMSVPPAETIFSTVVAHPHVQEAVVVDLAHPALGAVFGILVVLDSEGTVADVDARTRSLLPSHLHPTLVLRVPELPTKHDGTFNLSRARALLRDAASLERPETVRPAQRGNRDRVWEHLVGLAADEQVLLTEALGVLMATPDLERRVAKALGYPDWPMPLTLLPRLAPHLANAHPDLESYLAFWETAAADVLVAIDHFGWPRADTDGRHVTDAVWLLLQHCDLLNDARDAVLFAVTQQVACGRTDPRHLALLQDRTRSVMEEEQLFGTFMLRRDDSPHFLYPTPAVPELDRMRTRIGLPTVADDLPQAGAPLLPCRNVPRPPGVVVHVPPPDSPSVNAWRAVPEGTAPVYLGGPSEKRQELRELRAALTRPLYSTARWLDRSPGLCAVSQFDAGPAANRAIAQARMDDIRQSRLMIVLEGERPDALTRTEIGAALAAGTPVIRVGTCGDSLDDYPSVTVVPDAAAAADAANEWATQ